jgi:hypothetical protein
MYPTALIYISSKEVLAGNSMYWIAAMRLSVVAILKALTFCPKIVTDRYLI